MYLFIYFFQGSGKSVIVKQFADMLGYHVEPIMLYQVRTVNNSFMFSIVLARPIVSMFGGVCNVSMLL